LEAGIADLKRVTWLKQSLRASNGQEDAQELLCSDSSPRPTPSLFSPGVEPLPGYRLIEPLGSGGFGQVWKVLAPTGLVRAIKITHGDLNVLEESHRVQIELKGLERIRAVQHPLVLAPESVHIQGGRLMVVTELAGTSLGEHFRLLRQKTTNQRVFVSHALPLLRDVAEALDYIHDQHQLQHLDIKPSNLLIVGGMCKIADFGTVAHLQSKTSGEAVVVLRTPSPGEPEGVKTCTYRSYREIPWPEALRRDASLFTITGGFTPYCAPPEAFQGMVSRTFDQYSLALSFCELVAGRTPFGDDPDQFARRSQGTMDMSFLPAALLPVFLRALSPEPSTRFPSCVQFMEALSKAVAQAVWYGIADHGKGRQFLAVPRSGNSYITLALKMEGRKTASEFPWSLNDNAPVRTFNSLTVLVGQDEDCALRVTDASVSGRHAVILQYESSYSVRDIDSDNGTYLNDALVRPGDYVPLKPLDTIRFGNVAFQVDKIWYRESKSRVFDCSGCCSDCSRNCSRTGFPYWPCILDRDDGEWIR
jgi:serine/threonine protein kinase